MLAVTVAPVIDGQWSDWDPWTSCSATCDGGMQRRVRRCDDPSPQNDGSDCVGVITEYRDCSQWACPGKRVVFVKREQTLASMHCTI